MYKYLMQMEHLKGKIIHKRLQKEHFTKIGDLLFFEGSLMTLFKDAKNNNQLFLFDWADSDATYNRWLMYNVKPIDILNYLNLELTHLDLIKKSIAIYCVDIDIHLNFHNYQKIDFSNLPNPYLPADNCLFDKTECPDLAKIEAQIEKMLVLQTVGY